MSESEGKPSHEEAAEQSVRPARSVASATMLSRILGLIRDKVTVFVFPVATAEAVLMAWTVPNLFRRLFGEGALAAALVPVLAGAEKDGGADQRDRIASAVISALVAFLAPFTLVLWWGLWALPDEWVTAPFESTEVARQTRSLLLWMLPFLVLVCVAAQLQAVANLVGRFFLPAFAPALSNVFWIAAAVVAGLVSMEHPDAHWVAGAILIAGCLQVVVQWWELRRVGVRLRWEGWQHPEVRDVISRALPMVMGLAASQINIVVDRFVAEAWVEGDGAIRQLYLGNRLMQLPLGLIGVALGTSVYPILARAAAHGDSKTLAASWFKAARVALAFGLPAMTGLALLARPIMQLLFEGGEFSSADSRVSAACLVAYAPTLVFQSVVLLQARVEYARGRQKRVVRVGLVAVTVNVVLDFVFVTWWQAPGLALATTVATGCNALLLARGLELHGEGLWRRGLLLPTVRLVGCAVVMGLAVFAVAWGIERAGVEEWLDVFGLSMPLHAGLQVIAGIAAGVVVFFLSLWSLSRSEFREILSFLRR